MPTATVDTAIVHKFTSHLKKLLERAFGLAQSQGAPQVSALHLLISLMEQQGSIGAEVLRKYRVAIDELHRMLHQGTRNREQGAALMRASLPRLSSEAKMILEKSVLAASHCRHTYVGTEHLLWGMVEYAEAMDDSSLAMLFKTLSLSLEQLRGDVKSILKTTSKFPEVAEVLSDPTAHRHHSHNAPDAQASAQTPALDFFTTDLTLAAHQGKLDPLIGRVSEVERVIQVLARRTKNNPLLVGDAGVGKTAIVEGLSQRIATQRIPPMLMGKRVLALDMGIMVAGSVFRGEFEARLKQVIEEAKRNSQCIIFIDELHTIVGAGSAGGTLDAANMLKPALARGEIRCIGATTFEEYKKHIERDAALNRRFQPIEVCESSREETRAILEGLKETYERFHRVTITTEALEEAVRLSMRYLPDRVLPDKAIDCIDEAASRLRLHEKPDAAELVLQELERTLQGLRQQKIDAINNEQFEIAVGVRSQEQEVMNTLAAHKQKLQRRRRRPLGSLTPHHIRETMSAMTGVRIDSIVSGENERIEHLEEDLGRTIIGQTQALRVIATTIRRSLSGLTNHRRPLGSFLLVGPSGSGKTATARSLARLLTWRADDEGLIRIDMSEFAEGYTISKLIGSPAGYVGYRESGLLTDSVRRRPSSVILFDEIEKAHPDVFHLLLQVLEDGRLTDGSGRIVHFNQSIVILTSNIGSEKLFAEGIRGFDEIESSAQAPGALEHDVLKSVRDAFRPELLNRLDAIIPFRLLEPQEHTRVLGHFVEELNERLKERSVKVEMTDAAAQWIAHEGWSPVEGARSLRKALEEEVETPLADLLLRRGASGALFTVDYSNGTITIDEVNG